MNASSERDRFAAPALKGGFRLRGSSTLVALATLASSLSCWATDSAAPGAMLMEEVYVYGDQASVPKRLAYLPGGATLITAEDVESTANLTLSRALASAPGVVVQDFFGGNDQPRVQIRGSGLQQNPVERGVLVLQNGLPLNRADGSYVVGFANPAQAHSVEVYRGYLANRLGAAVLGGALNFMSPTGRDANRASLSLSGGSFGQLSALGQAGFSRESVDAHLRFDISDRDGYRDYNDSRRVYAGANLGVMLTDTVSLRLFADHTDLRFDVAGPLTAEDLENDPQSVHAGPSFTPQGPKPGSQRDSRSTSARHAPIPVGCSRQRLFW